MNSRLAEKTGTRFGERFTLELPVRLGIDGRTLGRGLIRNASISGALIETSLELPLHSNLIVTITMHGESTPATRELAACVMRVDPAGIAVEWRDMACADITALLERASGRTGLTPLA